MKMNKFIRCFNFIKKNISNNNIRFLFTYSVNYFNPNFSQKANFLNEEGLVKAISSGKSLIRYGDGEIYMINFGSIPIYEDFNPKLRDYLIKAVKDYSKESPYLIGIPQSYINMPNSELRKMNLLNCWLPLKVTFRHIFPKKVSYFDAHQFYRGKSFENILESELKDKHVLVVTAPRNIKMMKEVGMDKKLNVTYIPTRERDSFGIIEKIVSDIKENTFDKEKTRVLLSTGPASKVLAYILSQEGIICYDLGKGIEAAYRPNTIESMI